MINNLYNKKPIVIHVTRKFLPLTETFIGNQVISVQKYKPIVVCYRRIENPSYPIKDLISVQDVLSPFERFLDFFEYNFFRRLLPSAARKISLKLRMKKPSLLHFHFLSDAALMLNIKKQTGLPALVSGYGHDVTEFPKRYLGYGGKYIKPLFQNMDLFVAMSDDMRHDMMKIGCPKEKIIVHYYGTDTDRFKFSERDYTSKKGYVSILVCGTLEVKKAQNLILKALFLAEQKVLITREFKIVFVGNGPLKSNLEKQIEAYGWRNKVCFQGHIHHAKQELVDLYRNADIFCLPSITAPNGDKEGIPGVIVEAMASGLPVVSTYHAGIPEIIDSEKDGLLVKEKDIDALAISLARLIESPELRKKLGMAAAKRAAENLDLGQKTIELESIYNNLVKNSQSGV